MDSHPTQLLCTRKYQKGKLIVAREVVAKQTMWQKHTCSFQRTFLQSVIGVQLRQLVSSNFEMMCAPAHYGYFFKVILEKWAVSNFDFQVTYEM